MRSSHALPKPKADLKNRLHPGLAVAVLCLAVGLLSAHLARRFPPVNTDEAFLAVLASNAAHGQGQRYSLFDDIFANSVYALRDVFPVASVLYGEVLAGWIAIFGKAIWTVRLFSVFVALSVLGVFYGIGSRMKGPRFGLLLAGILALNPVFLFSSLLLRPEVGLLLVSSVLLGLMIREPEGVSWRDYLFGIGVALLGGFHPNAIALVPAFTLFYCGKRSVRESLQKLALFALGGLTGAFLIFLSIDIAKFKLLPHTLWYNLTRPPLFSWPWTPWVWFAETVKAFLEGRTFYAQTDQTPGWTLAMAASWSALVLGWAGFIGQAVKGFHVQAPAWKRRLLPGMVLTLASLALFVKRHEVLYSLIVFPFGVPAVGFFLWEPGPWGPRVHRVMRGFIGLLGVVGAGSFLLFADQAQKNYRPFSEVGADVHRLLPDPSWKVAGPNVLWFDWRDELFRDLGAMVFSHWYTGGQRQIGPWLRQWKPDAVVLDETVVQTFFGNQPLARALPEALHAPVRWLGRVETGRAASGVWEVYLIDWKEDAAPATKSWAGVRQRLSGGRPAG